jgi:hypothetical protein
MTTSARLIGFCRRMPEVYTFVTPIFLNDAGTAVAQLDELYVDRVSSFQPADISSDFVPVEFDLSAKVGGALLHGFEVSDGALVFGHARMLARYLSNTLESSPGYRRSRPRTTAAIERFLDFAASQSAAAEGAYLFELTRLAVEGAYVLTGSSVDAVRGARQATPDTPEQWQEVILQNASIDHARFLDAHQTAQHRIEMLTLGSDNIEETRSDIEKSLATLLRGSSIEDGHLLFRNRPACHICLFELASRYPTQSALDKLIEWASVLTSIWPHTNENEIAIYTEALEKVHRFLVHRSSLLETAVFRARHLKLLSKLEADPALSDRCREMLAQLMASQRKSESDQIRHWQEENGLFFNTIDSAIKAGEHMRDERWIQ